MAAIRSRSRSVRGRQASRQRGDGEAIDMRSRRHGYFPELFVWRGRRYHVDAVERCWTVSRRKLSGRVERHCFRVRCRQGTFDLYQDLRYDTWHMQGKVA